MGNSVSKKFGSRILSDEEVKLTLPTYDKLLEQIEDMRNDEWDEEKSRKSQNQKINNISILGARGTGKTSILKTLIARLEKDNDKENKEENLLGKNIILPMIVPENMSTNSNLMSMILGLFKGIVDKIEEKENSGDKDCWFSKENEISKKYRELVRRFCFIQPDFKSVSIEQYTTENDYVKKSSEIYQADIGFMSCFNEFINILLKRDKQDENQRLIFVFIDDMDLSTHRCVDAVRTLLAYISHPRIVTVLAGDLETFEEALTLDFIRQDKTMRAGILESTFVVGNDEENKYLTRKKALTYEYLKKVIPVVYRHNLREWSLETRGNYIVKGNADNEKSLVELLNACFIKRYEKYPIFQYFEKGKDGEYERKNLPQMFHIFDHTARGLNAVYNVLLETYNIMQNGEEDKKFTQTKILLETIVGSNSLFNQYRKQIFENIIKFGVDFEDTRIECENFRSFIAKEFSKNNLDSSKTKSKIKDEKKVINLQDILFNQAVKIFGFFVLLDFSIRVLEKNEVLNDKTYLELKRDNIINLINIPAISESMAISENIVKGSEKGGIVLIKDLENKESKIMSNIILGFLSDMDFGYALTLFHFLYKNGNNYIFEKIAVNTTDLEWIYKKCLILYDMVKSISWLKYVEQESNWQAEIKNILTYLILEFEGKFRELLGILKGGKELSQLLKILLNELLDKMKFNGNVFSTDKGNENYKEEYKTVFLNTLAENLENKIFNDKNLISLAEKRSEYEKLLVKRPFMKERILIINAVDKYHLWEDEFSSNVKKYIKNILIDCLGRIQCDELDRVDISCFKTKWDKFKNSKMGSSETLAKKLERYISGLLGKEENYKIQFRTFIELLDEISKLAYSKARYGREAAFEMLKEVQNVKLINLFEHEYEEEVKEFMDIFYAFIHMYASYIFDDNKNIYLLSKEIAEFKNIIYDSSIDGIGNQIKTFNDLLANEVGEEVLSKLEELFPA